MDSPPVKPPRGVKYGKETSGCGLLVSVIKTLDASETNEQREREKLKIEKEFRKTDQRLNELVSRNDGDLTRVMQLFGKVSVQVTSSRERIHVVKENLQSCKQLLRCRREELKKLYTDAIQHKCVLEMLDQVNELRRTPQQLASFMAKKHYLHATKLLRTSVESIEGPLKDVEGLQDLRQDLQAKRHHLYSKLLEELNKHLYVSSTDGVLQSFQRQSSGRNSHSAAAGASPFQRNVLRRSAERVEANTKARKALFEIAQNGYMDVDKSEIIEDTDLLDPDVNSTYFIGIIIECFALLNKVPDSIESLRTHMQSELLAIVTKSTHHIVTVSQQQHPQNHAQGANASEDLPEQKIPILELLDLVFKQFKLIANAHQLTLKNYHNVMHRYNLPQVKAYDLIEYWGQAQAVLKLVLTDYLDIQNDSSDELMRTQFTEQTTNINTFFSRRKVQGKKLLFKFDKSSHTVDVEPSTGSKEHRRNPSNVSNSTGKEQDLLNHTGPNGSNLLNSSFNKHHPSAVGVHDKKKQERQLVCTPDAALVRNIYLPMMGYIHEIESFMKCKSGQLCSLNTFLANYVKDAYLARGHNRNLQLTIDSLSKTQDAWRTIITPEEMKRLGLARPLLQNTVLVESRISETKKLIEDLPTYSDELLKMVCSLLKTYRETCQAAYRGIVQPETEDKRIYSVAWLKDDDIMRFLKSLPNWTDLINARLRQASQKRGMKAEPSEEESPTAVQQRNIREAEMLTSNLGEGGISQQEILSDVGVLKELAILQESMEWFAGRITDFASDLRKPIANGLMGSGGVGSSPVVVKDGMIKVLMNLALEFEELANTCLLVLHLEVRVQCFHYLKSNPSDKFKANNPNKNDSLEPDAKVLKLTKVLSDMDEALSSTLHPRKTKYVFEGLAHLASRILVMAANSMEAIDHPGVQRMCRNALALQQTLSSITASREVALDYARSFYEMFYLEPDEILTSIIEKGSQFTEMQYLNALHLVCKNRGISDQNTLAMYQQKLCDVLGNKPGLGVTV
ncbi:exocyst complex component 4 isoform X2 [Uranotaenia lowii]|uniref:exocyst complex component 4-like isoform X2 n=1 Tax=Uranotaenia lowii TaxID=190385 RepID=UPI002478B0BB|nr:exocyst complex component 4-like isoform X2 [Uranotaenia lowii]XP_055606581.1 exocyst complex component 4 isoform X2 [Uranotaenia lowii]